MLHQIAVFKEKCRITCGEPQSKKKKRLTAALRGGANLANLAEHIWFRSHPEDFLAKTGPWKPSDPASLPTQDFRHGRLGLEQVKQ